MTADWEHKTIHLHAEALRRNTERLSAEALAERFSAAIIQTVTEQRSDRWQMLKMEFHGGRVELHFRRATHPAPPD